MSERELKRSEQLPPTGMSTPVAHAEPDPRRMAALQRRSIQRKATRADAGKNVRVPEGSGAPLPAQLSARMGQQLGADLSDVKVHTGGDSAEAADRLGAKAFAVDKNVHFAAGQWSPESKEGQRLIAHELAHVAQGQSGAHAKREVSRPGDPAEVEADEAADRVVAGERAPVAATQGARLHLNKDKDKAAPAKEGEGDAAAESPDKATPGAEAGGDKAAEAGGDKAEAGGDKAAEAKPKSAGGYDNLVSLAESMTPENVAAWAANPEICLAILKGPFEANWFKAKECLLMNKWPDGIDTKPEHGQAMALMDGLVKMRSVECEKVQKRAEKEIQTEVQKESQKTQGLDDPMSATGVQGQLGKEGAVDNEKSTGTDGKEKPGKQVEFKAPVGNQKRTSDIDTATGGMNTEMAVALFNRLFKEMLDVPYESGTMFDYNVYAMDWIHNLKFDKGKAPGAGGAEKDVTTKITPGAEHELPGEGDKKERNATLEKASILHIRRYMAKPEWDVYCKGRIDKAAPGEKAELQIMLDEVDVQHTDFNNAISAKSTVIEAEMGKALEGHESAWGEHNQHFQDEAVKTRASNRIYEERLREVKSLRAQYQILSSTPMDARKPDHAQQLAELAKQVTKILSEALFFANEVYASEGATLHVVLGMQGAAKKSAEQADTGVQVKVPLTPEQYMQSFNENVGDVLKDLGHYKSNPSFAVFRAGKYMDRMCKAATAMTPEAQTHALYPKLLDLSAKAVTVKESPKGDDPLATVEEFKDWNPSKLDGLRAEVIQFGSDIPAQAQAAQEKSKAVEVGATPPQAEGAAAATEAPKGGADAAATNPLIGKAKEATSVMDALVTELSKNGADAAKPDGK